MKQHGKRGKWTKNHVSALNRKWKKKQKRMNEKKKTWRQFYECRRWPHNHNELDSLIPDSGLLTMANNVYWIFSLAFVTLCVVSSSFSFFFFIWFQFASCLRCVSLCASRLISHSTAFGERKNNKNPKAIKRQFNII